MVGIGHINGDIAAGAWCNTILPVPALMASLKFRTILLPTATEVRSLAGRGAGGEGRGGVVVGIGLARYGAIVTGGILNFEFEGAAAAQR